MKRSEFKPSKQALHRSAMKAGTKRLRAYRSRKASSGDIFRCGAYLDLVRGLECMSCAIEKLTEPAHSNQLRFGKAKGLKSSDATAMALCKTVPGRHGCHNNHDQGGKLSKAEWKAFEHRMIAKTITELLRRGKLVADEGVLLALPADIEELAITLVGHIENNRIRVAT